MPGLSLLAAYAFATVAIDTPRAGAVVMLDGRYAGVTPFRKDLPPGRYGVSVEGQGAFTLAVPGSGDVAKRLGFPAVRAKAPSTLKPKARPKLHIALKPKVAKRQLVKTAKILPRREEKPVVKPLPGNPAWRVPAPVAPLAPAGRDWTALLVAWASAAVAAAAAVAGAWGVKRSGEWATASWLLQLRPAPGAPPDRGRRSPSGA